LLARDHFQEKEDGKGERGRDVLFPFSERGGKRPARLYEEKKKKEKKKNGIVSSRNFLAWPRP
jgi:hypothetical protein